MRIWKRIMLLIGIYILLFSTINAIAEEDPTGDIYHQTATETGLTWDLYSGEKQHIDITDISYSISGSQATLTMTLADDIVSSEFVYYYMHLRSSENSFYQALYSDENGIITGVGDFTGFYNIIDNPISGNIFTATFEVSDPNLEYKAWGWTGEFSDFSNQGGEGWLDYAPGTFAPWYSAGGGDGDGNGGTGDGNDDDTNGDDGTGTNGDDGTDTTDGTPGFETLTIIAALGIAFILLRRKK